MVKNLTSVLISEKDALEKLRSLLKDQYSFLMSNDVFQLEAIVEKIELCSKEVAQLEIERRKIIGENNIKQVVEKSKDEKLKKEFNEITQVVQLVKFQKDTNEMLIKQQMSFNRRIISIINPNREMKTYNSYGILKR